VIQDRSLIVHKRVGARWIRIDFEQLTLGDQFRTHDGREWKCLGQPVPVGVGNDNWTCDAEPWVSKHRK